MHPPALATIKLIVEITAQLVVVIGFPFAIIQYRRTKRREALDREYGTYNALDDKYIAFQKLCLAHPRLDVFDVPLTNPPVLEEEERQQELIAFTMLMSVFERSFLMYKDQTVAIQRDQWDGWLQYIDSYCRRQNFRNAWIISGETFDLRFQEFMKDMLQRTSSIPARD